MILVAGILTLTSHATLGQIANPELTPPPCIGAHCLVRLRGATAPRAPAPSLRKHSCPQGTVFDVYRGDCRVTPLSH